MNIKSGKIPQIKKNLKTFLLSEEGKMTKKDIAKMAVVIIAVAGAVGGAVRHSDAALSSCGHASHGSHGSHGSHSRGGWC